MTVQQGHQLGAGCRRVLHRTARGGGGRGVLAADHLESGTDGAQLGLEVLLLLAAPISGPARLGGLVHGLPRRVEQTVQLGAGRVVEADPGQVGAQLLVVGVPPGCGRRQLLLGRLEGPSGRGRGLLRLLDPLGGHRVLAGRRSRVLDGTADRAGLALTQRRGEFTGHALEPLGAQPLHLLLVGDRALSCCVARLGAAGDLVLGGSPGVPLRQGARECLMTGAVGRQPLGDGGRLRHQLSQLGSPSLLLGDLLFQPGHLVFLLLDARRQGRAASRARAGAIERGFGAGQVGGVIVDVLGEERHRRQPGAVVRGRQRGAYRTGELPRGRDAVARLGGRVGRAVDPRQVARDLTAATRQPQGCLRPIAPLAGLAERRERPTSSVRATEQSVEATTLRQTSGCLLGPTRCVLGPREGLTRQLGHARHGAVERSAGGGGVEVAPARCEHCFDRGALGIVRIARAARVGAALRRRWHRERLEVADQVVDPSGARGELGPGRRHLARELATTGRQPVLDVGEAAGVEQPLQQAAAILRGGPQEGGELALGQHHHLGELLEAEADHVVDHLGHLVEPRAPVDPLAARQLLQEHLRLDGGLPVTPALGPAERGAAGDPQPTAGRGEFELHLRDHVGGGVVAAQRAARTRARAGHGGIQGEADGVEDAGLAGAGGAVDQVQPGWSQLVETHLLGAGERAERGHPQLVQPHATPRALRPALPSSSRRDRSRRDSSTARASNARSASSASAPPRTCDRKSQHSSRSSRCRVREA